MISVFIWNSIAVGFFGMILSAAFCDIDWTPKKRLLMIGYMVLLMILQGILYTFVGGEGVRFLYPLIIHIPLMLVLKMFSGKGLWAIVSVLTSYLCCQLRRWIALLVVAITQGDALMQDTVELLITIPLLVVLLKFVAPSVRYISHYTKMEQARFAVIPLLGYGFDYLTRVYTDLLSTGTPVIVEFMFFICCGLYLLSVIQSSVEEQKRNQMEQTQGYLNLQVAQSVKEIESLRNSQKKASMYRHDLRHHMMYISSCIENGYNDQAQEYIQEICSEIEASKVEIYSENEAVNLILSAFAGKAEENGISIEVNVALPAVVRVSESDLCVLLSNALENALDACQKLKAKGLGGRIEVAGFEKNHKLFFEVTNTCDETIRMKGGIPISQEAGHGIGVRSICAIVEKYDGMYSFSVKDNQFILRISL